MQHVQEFAAAKRAGRRVTMVTAYDAPSARLVARAGLDSILVGDSLAMVVHGHASTLAATVEMMAVHTAAVARGAPGVFTVADLPFLSFRAGVPAAVEAAGALMRAGAQAVKLEGVRGHEDVIERLVGSGIPVMGHLGLTPQSVHAMGGYRVQARGEEAAERLRLEARRLEDLGVFAIVLECIPAGLAGEVTAALAIPTIGIGAGPQCDGQVLVWHDLLGLQSEIRPRFVRRFLEGETAVAAALEAYAAAVREGTFPAAEESFA